MKQIMYQSAYDDNDLLVDINDVIKEETHIYSYKCICCGGELIPKLGYRRRHHFAHKNEVECNGETYLHQLGKYLIKKKFNDPGPFNIQLTRVYICNEHKDCQLYKLQECVCEKTCVYNLKECYDTCLEEASIDKFRADLLIRDSKGEHKDILIEIKCTHESTIEKRNSGHRIIEIRVESEEQLKNICSQDLKAGDDIEFIGFEIQSKQTSNEASRDYISRFILFKKGKAHSEKYTNCKGLCNRNAIFEMIVGNDFQTNPYTVGYVKAYIEGVKYKSCHMCKYRRKNRSIYTDAPHFCCLYKKCSTPKNPVSSYANECQYYTINQTLVDQTKSQFDNIKFKIIKNTAL